MPNGDPDKRVKRLKAERARLLDTPSGGQGSASYKNKMNKIKAIDSALIASGNKPKPRGTFPGQRSADAMPMRNSTVDRIRNGKKK